MATAQRVFWETVTFLVLVAAIACAWFLSQWLGARRVERLTDGQQAVLAEKQAEHATELDELRGVGEQWAENLAQSEAEAVFSAYAAGIHPMAVARWGRVLNESKSEFLKHPKVTFVHLLTPEGRVLASSDQKYVTRGTADERAGWALEATERVSRESAFAGITELAAPIKDGGRVRAVLWLGYSTAEAKDSARPEPSN